MQLALTLAAHVFTGFILMLVSHFAAFLGSTLGLPYWWAYLVLYPIAAVASVKLKYLSPLQAAASLCAAPVLYFLAIGVVNGSWHSSSNALIGAVLAFGLSFALAKTLGRNKASVRTAA